MLVIYSMGILNVNHDEISMQRIWKWWKKGVLNCAEFADRRRTIDTIKKETVVNERKDKAETCCFRFLCVGI